MFFTLEAAMRTWMGAGLARKHRAFNARAFTPKFYSFRLSCHTTLIRSKLIRIDVCVDIGTHWRR
ncbi:protein of unknown function (plasmid) [Cupriavidus taiwanensis]|uniref:Uncharacterized protein n=1 Tax=Cupriavidus taiwanensis TaxID=164546 RepID=A0A375FHM5_9BURK|nr:protein of unknown function [Cupriavidus taiwanensis]SPA57238.1 protein of unknown function [Cupriavidus taiwanensis]SPD48856.1 protein of unknown function [Cupriavidus taiwanensis]